MPVPVSVLLRTSSQERVLATLSVALNVKLGVWVVDSVALSVGVSIRMVGSVVSRVNQTVVEFSLPAVSFAHTVRLFRPSRVVYIVVLGVKLSLVPLVLSWYHQAEVGSFAETLSWIVLVL